MQRLHKALLWIMDVMVAVFIGPVDAGKRAPRVKRMAARRSAYALAFLGVILLAAAAYAIAFRWPSVNA